MRRAYLQAVQGTKRRAAVPRVAFGDVAPTETATLTPDAQTSDLARELLTAQRAMVAAQQEQVLWQKRWTAADIQQRRLQIAAILAVPLAGIFWRWFLGSRTASRLGLD